MIRKDFIGNNKTVRIMFFLISPFFLYLPVLHKYFVSDDFKVLNRVCLHQVLLIKRFFRPLSDLTIYLNYRIGGFDPVIFNAFNFGVHGFNSLLLYEFCLRIRLLTDHSANKYFAFVASILFLTYPFHNEGVVWLLGRGASLSCTFALAGMIAVLSHYGLSKRILMACICYFIGLLAYESVILFPALILAFLTLNKKGRKEKTWWIICLLLTLGAHLTARVLISGNFTGSYGAGFFAANPFHYILNIPKTAMRLILPPTGDLLWLEFVYAAILIAVALLSIFLLRRFSGNPSMRPLKWLFVCLCIACVTPFVSGVSTKTSETDRMLYFPSVFLCMIIAAILAGFVGDAFKRLLICCLLLVYNICFLEKNNSHWAVAGETTQSLVNLLKDRTRNGKVFVADVPSEYKGAFIFRQGLNDALEINSIDPSKVTVVNYLRMEETFLPPLSTLKQPLPKTSQQHEVIYWNKRQFIPLPQEPGKKLP